MLKFFRKIREKLFVEGNLKKYLFYAFGEILLLVLGILIALQINNWNEERKRNIVEIETLKELKAGMISDLGDIRTNINLHKKAVRAAVVLKDRIESELEYHDSLAQHFMNCWNFSFFISRSSAYETLKAKGMELISNQSIRKALAELYDFDYEFTFKKENYLIGELMESKKFIVKNFQVDYPHQMVPINYERLIRDVEFQNRLSYMSDRSKSSLYQYKSVLSKCFSTLLEIETEIQKLEGRSYKTIPCHFSLKGNASANNVFLTGDFVFWQSDYYAMDYNPDKKEWHKTIELIPGKRYLYKFVIDGKWTYDEMNLNTEDDGLNGLNSVLIVPKN